MSNKVVYEINGANEIVKVGEGWNKAALEGGAQELAVAENVINHPIEEFQASDVTQMYYDAVFKLCRLKQEVMHREYRCDSFTHKRYMKVTLYPLENNHIRLVHETLKEEPFDHEVIVHEKATLKLKNYVYVKRCSVCNSLKFSDSEDWVTPESLSKKESVDLNVIHTVCEKCRKYKWHTIKKK